MKKIVYTIGYTSFDIKTFVDMLKTYKINCLIDVRSSPKSSYYKDFNEENLKYTLKNANIIYRNYKDEFGARQENLKFYPNGYLDFDLFSQSDIFKSGIEKINKAIDMNYNVCLMCAEKDPINCHRTILVGRQLSLYGFEIYHILADKTLCKQETIDERLLKKFYPNIDQLSLFSEDNLTDEEAIINAYKKQNAEIGFKLEGED